METGAESRTSSQTGADPINIANKSGVPQSLFNECSALGQRLRRIRGFSDFFLSAPTDSDTSEPLDPVVQLWDIFSTGIPLCYLFNHLPEENGLGRIDPSSVYPDGSKKDPNRTRMRAIALFIMRLRTDNFQQQIPGVEPNITVTDLLDRSSTSGFAKVVHAVSAILDHIPASSYVHLLELDNVTPTHTTDPVVLLAKSSRLQTSDKAMVSNIAREIVETERKYNHDLESILSFSQSLSKTNIIDADLLFPGIARLVETQHKFLLLLEETAKLEFHEQRWGRCYLECEDGFTDSYATYCANYGSTAKKQLEVVGQSLSLDRMNKYEIESMVVRPLSRICKYPLLYGSLFKAYSPLKYPHYEELKRGLEASKRVCEHVNDACRHSENKQIAMDLTSRVQDWKGCLPNSFGELLLDDDCLLVSNSDITQEYQPDDDFCLVSKSNICQQFEVFLFEQVIILANVEFDSQMARKATGGQQRTSPLILKGHVFLEDVIRAVPVTLPRISFIKNDSLTPTGTDGYFRYEYPLAIWWKDEGEQEQSFVLRFKREDQMHHWQARINTIIQGHSEKRSSGSNSGSSDVALAANQYPTMRNIYSYMKPGKAIKSKKPQSSRSYLTFGGSCTGNSKSHASTSGDDHDSKTIIPPSTKFSSHSNHSIHLTDSAASPSVSKVKVKVKLGFQGEIFFTLRLPRTMGYEELKAIVGRKVSLCGLQREPLRMRYYDEDDDLVSIGSTEDVQMFFDQYIDHSGYPIILLVT